MAFRRAMEHPSWNTVLHRWEMAPLRWSTVLPVPH